MEFIQKKNKTDYTVQVAIENVTMQFNASNLFFFFEFLRKHTWNLRKKANIIVIDYY